MTEQISQRELRNDSGRIMRALDEGKSFVVSRHGQPVGELRPLRRGRFVDAGIVGAAFKDRPEIDLAQLRRAVDDVVEQSGEPRG